MENDFVLYDIARTLKELGYGISPSEYIQLTSFYDLDGNFFNNNVRVRKKINHSATHLGADTIKDFEAVLSIVDNSLDTIILAPTYYQVFAWFREEIGLDGYVSLLGGYYLYTIYKNKWTILECTGKFETYREGEIACITNLIEIMKKV